MTVLSSRRNTIALAAACLACLMFGLEISSIPAILPTLERVLHADFKSLQWIMNAYTIAVTTVLMAVGTVADRYDRKRIFLVAIAAFGVTSLICGVASSVEMLADRRAIPPGPERRCAVDLPDRRAVARIPGRPPARRRLGRLVGASSSASASASGRSSAVPIVAVLSWEWVFLVHVLFAAVAFVLTIGGVHESSDPKASTSTSPAS